MGVDSSLSLCHQPSPPSHLLTVLDFFISLTKICLYCMHSFIMRTPSCPRKSFHFQIHVLVNEMILKGMNYFFPKILENVMHKEPQKCKLYKGSEHHLHKAQINIQDYFLLYLPEPLPEHFCSIITSLTHKRDVCLVCHYWDPGSIFSLLQHLPSGDRFPQGFLQPCGCFERPGDLDLGSGLWGGCLKLPFSLLPSIFVISAIFGGGRGRGILVSLCLNAF